MKRFISACIVIFLLLIMVTVSASSAGTAADPLISYSYFNGTFIAALKSEISQMVNGTSNNAVNKLNELFSKYAAYNFASGFTRIALSNSDTVILSTGSSFILMSGSATLTLVNGTVINISTGLAVAAGARLIQYQRYFCTEDTMAIITANSASIGQVDGYYIIEPSPANKQHPVFRDVREKDWFYSAVDYVYSKNLFGGTSPNAFSPSASMTRGMFVTVLYRLEGEPSISQGGQFSDVINSSLYYYNAVTWASANNIVLGYSNGTFGPNNSVTREQIATIMYRYAQYKHRDMSANGSLYNTFPDRGDVSVYAVAAMQWVVSSGVINGSGGKLLPGNTASRAEVAQIIYNYITIIG